MKKVVTKILFVFYLMLGFQFGFAQSMQHPIIFATSDDRARVLELIDTYSWAENLKKELKEIVDPKVKAHQTNPNLILNSIPKIAEDDNIKELKVTTVHHHAAIMQHASFAALLYYISEEETYAQFAADILWYYAEELATRTPENTSICGNGFLDPRTSYSHFAIAYDFIYNYLKLPNAKVYSSSKKKYINYDHALMQKAIKNIVGNSLQEFGEADAHGGRISNHAILKAPGVLFSILCVEEDRERERLFNVFWEQGTAHQYSFKHTILPMFGTQGIWPESTSYSFMPNVTMILNIVDRIKPDMNVMAENMHILDGNFLFDNLRMPDRRFVSYGDSHRGGSTRKLYSYTLDLAKRRGFTAHENMANVALHQLSDANGGYSPHARISTYDNYSVFTQLLWRSTIPEKVEGTIDFQKPTVIIEHAGVALQRNYVEEKNELYGLCGIIGGAHYVHSHLTGISMELYGAGYVMAPNAGLPGSVAQRRIPLHEHYFRLYAGNNSVIVNGTSHGLDQGSWKGRAHVWQNRTINIASEPKHLEEPLNENFSFATQFLGDEVNNCDQQRTLSTIRTSDTTAYYFDLFRSKSLDKNKFHDYIYHNIGDQATLTNADNTRLAVVQTDRYQNDIGDTVHSPGWRYFEKTKTTAPTDEAVKLRFDIEYDNRSMHMFIPSGVNREYTKALAPASRDVRNGYNKKKTQVIAIRQKGEAWEKPYLAIFEPSIGANSSVKSVEHLYTGDTIVGAKVTSKVGSETVIDYVICHDEESKEFILPSKNLYFKGRFAVARSITKNNQKEIELYIGEGEKLSFENKSITSY
ncbi:MAG: hypothetical protein RLO09_03295 [Cyclobacteriaceae bacterium]